MKHRKRGQALSETLIGMLVLAPLLILIPYIGKYLDVKHKAQDANRYALWERTVFSDDGSWNAGENSKPDTTIAREINLRMLGDPRAPLNTTTQAENLLWRDHRDGELVTLDARTFNLSESDDPFSFGLSDNEFLGTPEGASLVTALAYDGLPLLNELDALSDFLGGALDFNLGLNDSGFAQATVSIPAVSLPNFVRDGVIQDGRVTTDVLNFQATGALLSDAWVPGSEDNYRKRIDGLVVDEIVQLLVLPGTFTFGFFPLFKEGLDGQNPKLETESKVIPPRYVETD